MSLFIDPMLGSSLSVYVDPGVHEVSEITQLLLKHGATVSLSYANVTYILVDPATKAGQSLYRECAHKRNQLVLNYHWVHECLRAGRLHAFESDFAGCRVTGTELVQFPITHQPIPLPVPQYYPLSDFSSSLQQLSPSQRDPWNLIPDQSASVQQWPDTSYVHPQLPTPPSYDFQYANQPQQQSWPPGPSNYHPSDQFDHHCYQYADDPIPPPHHSSQNNIHDSNQYFQPLDQVQQDIRPQSPIPPTRVVKNNCGGALFTPEDVEYVENYAQYCQDIGIPLSLKEVCEQVAVKAPHHTFNSWHHFCNKNSIRLGYTIDPPPPDPDDDTEHAIEDVETFVQSDSSADGFFTLDPLSQQVDVAPPPPPPRERSPTPPRSLYRSTAGKGIAFTEEDVIFLVRFMDHRRTQGTLDMTTFWKEVAEKAPHHSRASWMKYWRRHKHELEHNAGDEPLPVPPDKKVRYSRQDDLLLAQFFARKPVGTLDEIFQAFGRLYPHHPWKGWQEHFRIHREGIEHLLLQVENGYDPHGYETT